MGPLLDAKILCYVGKYLSFIRCKCLMLCGMTFALLKMRKSYVTWDNICHSSDAKVLCYVG